MGYFDVKTNNLLFGEKNIVEFVSSQFKEKSKFKGITIFLTNLNSQMATLGALSQMYPASSGNIIVFSSELKKESTFAHEIGHILGLQHSFSSLGTSSVLGWAKNSISIQQENIVKQKSEIVALRAQAARMLDKQSKDRLLNNIKSVENSLNKNIESLSQNRMQMKYFSRSKYLFLENSTDNVMDYSYKQISFWHWQWKIMLSEINFYGIKTLSRNK